MKNQGLLFCLLLVCSISSGAEIPRWPLEIEISPSSSFAEFRGMRFHGGVDLRTRKTTGFPVYAIADGFVSRIKVQHRGFGYAIYVDHPSLNIRSVFGHLDDYADPMATYTREKLKKMGSRYGIDDYFGPEKFPVKRNQIIAYTGETGLGPPHLHFELRTMKDEPISPTTVGLKVPDNIIPELLTVYFDPLSAEARINGLFTPFSLPLKKANSKKYFWEKPVTISGKVGTQFALVDPGEGGNRFGVEEITMKIDEKTVFVRTFHQYSYDENNQCSNAYDYFRSSKRGTGYVYTMFKWPFDTLKFSEGYPAWGGTLDKVNPGRHTLTFEAIDFGGNIVTAEGPIVIENFSAMKNPFKGDLKLSKLHFNTFSVVGEYEGSALQGFDSVACIDVSGKEHLVPAVFSKQIVQVSFPNQEAFANGVKFKNVVALPKLDYADEKGGTIRSSDGARAAFPPESLRFPALGYLQPNLSIRGTKALPARSIAWEVLPDNLITGKPMKVEIPYVASCPLKHLGIYSPHGDGYSYEGGEIHDDRMVLSTRISGTYVVLEDSNPPTVKYAGIRNIKRLGKCWVYSYSDVGSGVDFESASVSINGKACDIDSDPDYDEFYVPVPKNQKKFQIKLEVYDHSGNVRELNESR